MTPLTTSRRFAFLLCVLLLSLAGCEFDPTGEPAQPAAVTPRWELSLVADGAHVKLPLEVMHVYLVEDHAHAETFEILGTGVTLVGEFPLDIHIDYDEHWHKLVGKTIELSDKGGDARQPRESVLTLPGQQAAKVVGGSFVVEQVGGQFGGIDGDMTLLGRITIRIETGDGEKTISGRFAVHCVSLG